MKARTKVMGLIGILLVVSLSFYSFSDNKDFKLLKNLDIFYSLFKELNYFYVDDTDPEKLIKTGIDEMLRSLDPYTTYIPESEMGDFNFMTTGKYGGIGALIRKAGDYTMISEPYEGFPAQKAGLMAGDTILEIDNKSTKGMPLSEVSENLKGDPDTKLKLLISRVGEEKPLKKTLIREQVSINNVPYFGMITDSVGYIRLSNFTKGANDEVKEALLELKTQGAEAIILDLRGNPGGLLIEAVRIVNLFVPKGQEIVSTKGKVKQWDNTYITLRQPVDTSIPLAVLVNRGSASASEIVAGSLQDLDRALVVGQRTFGKGLVQTTRPLSYNSQLKVTTAKYYIPSGRCIQALDYSHRNEDGSVGHIPDSLITEFKTKNGRTVTDGGGINPDIKMETEKINTVTIALYRDNLFFDYATYFRAKNDSIAPSNKFEISDTIFEQFISFAENQNFNYETKTDNTLNKLIEATKEEKYYDGVQFLLDSLENKLNHNIRKDINLFKDEISELLEEEISARYYFQKGRIETSVLNDHVIEETIDKLLNQEIYNNALHLSSLEEEVYAKEK